MELIGEKYTNKNSAHTYFQYSCVTTISNLVLMIKTAIALVIACLTIGFYHRVSAQEPTVILSQLSLKSKPMIKRTESLYRAVETPQINALETGYLISYTDENYHGHLLFLDDDFQLKNDVKLPRSGIVKVNTANNQIALLRCKYTFQKESVGPYYWEHHLFFEVYNLAGEKMSSTKLVGDQFFVKGRKNRTYRSKYEAALMEYDGTYYAAFSYQFNKTKKYDNIHHRLVRITPDRKVTVVNDLYKHIRQVQLLVHRDTLYHVYTQSRGPRAILLQKYGIKALNDAPVMHVEVGNTGKDKDRMVSVRAVQKNLFPITDGTDKKAFLCSDDLIPVRIEQAFITADTLRMVLCSMQDRKSYDLILANYSLDGNKFNELPLAAHRNLHETSGYVRHDGSALQLVYQVLDERNKTPDGTRVLTYNFATTTKTEHPLVANIATKPVFQFYRNRPGSASKLYQRDFRVNTRNYNHFNYNHLNTAKGMVLLHWDEVGIGVVRVEIEPEAAVLKQP